MTLVLSPSPDYRAVFRLAVEDEPPGSDVFAYQLNLARAVPTVVVGGKTVSVTPDGAFGKVTLAATKAFQTKAGLKVDGIAGIVTQRALFVKLAGSGGPSKLPSGLLAGIAEGESGFAVACFSEHPSDEGFDLGALQDSITPGEIGVQARYLDAYDIAHMARVTAEKIRRVKDSYFGRPGALTHRRAWELATLYHNWESAAENMSRGYGPYRYGDNDAPRQWIIAASGGRLSTPNQWVEAYIRTKTSYVTKWPA